MTLCPSSCTQGLGTDKGQCRPQVSEGVSSLEASQPAPTGPRARPPAPIATASFAEQGGVHKESPVALGNPDHRFKKALGAVPVQTSGGNGSHWQDFLAFSETAVGLQGGMENSGRNQVAGKGSRETDLETPAPGEPQLPPSQHAWLQSIGPPPALPQGQEGKHCCCRGIPWRGPLRQPRHGQVVWIEGSESASHDQPS